MTIQEENEIQILEKKLKEIEDLYSQKIKILEKEISSLKSYVSNLSSQVYSLSFRR